MLHPNNHLIESLETYKDLFDHANDLIHMVKPDGTILYVNRAWEKILEYTQEEIQGCNFYAIVAPEDKEAFIHYRNEVIGGLASDKRIEVRLLSKSGKEIIVEGFVSAREQEGQVLYTRGIFRDISIRLQNERQLQRLNKTLKERENNLEQLLTHAPDAVIVIDAASNILYWNPKAVTIFGWSQREAIGKKLVDTIIPTQYREAHNHGMSRYLATGKAKVLHQTMELTALNKDGQEFYISLTISNTLQNGKAAFIAFIRNIDKEKRNELELEKKRLELEQTNEELEQFAYVASHDLQEPLRKIEFYTNMVLEKEVTEYSKKYLARISASAQRMKGLIRSLLDFSKLSHNHLIYESTDLNTIVRQVLIDYELLIRQKEAVIEIDNLPSLDALPLQMNQLFFNLVGNSLKFSRQDVPPVIKITCKSLSSDTINHIPSLSTGMKYFELSISDNGIGFNPEYGRKLFVIFQRLHQRSQYEGYGIGLAVCQKIIEKHKGIIWAEGQPMGGAKFTFILPFKQPESTPR